MSHRSLFLAPCLAMAMAPSARAASTDAVGIVETPLFFAMWDTSAQKASSPECAQKRSQMEEAQNALITSSAYKVVLNSPMQQRVHATREAYQAQCQEVSMLFEPVTGPCKELKDDVQEAWSDLAESCEMMALREGAESKTLDAVREQYYVNTCSEEAFALTFFMMLQFDSGRLGEMDLPYRRVERLFDAVARSPERAALHDDTVYQQLAVAAEAYNTQCSGWRRSSEEACTTLLTQAKNVADQLKTTDAWQQMVASGPYTQVTMFLRAWPTRCDEV